MRIQCIDAATLWRVSEHWNKLPPYLQSQKGEERNSTSCTHGIPMGHPWDTHGKLVIHSRVLCSSFHRPCSIQFFRGSRVICMCTKPSHAIALVVELQSISINRFNARPFLILLTRVGAVFWMCAFSPCLLWVVRCSPCQLLEYHIYM